MGPALRAAVTLLALAGTISAGKFKLDLDISSNNFDDEFEFLVGTDSGRFSDENTAAHFLGQAEARGKGMYRKVKGAFQEHIYLGVDNTTVPATSAPAARGSFRVQSKRSFRHGLIIARFAHLPKPVCGAWPAFFTLGDEPWPRTGEIDLYEGWNLNSNNMPSLHVSTASDVGECKLMRDDQAATLRKENCDNESQSRGQGCQVEESGGGMGSPGGGIRTFPRRAPQGGGIEADDGTEALLWNTDEIKIYTWPHGSSEMPPDLDAAEVDPQAWTARPSMHLRSAHCDIDGAFQQQKILLDISFCGKAADDLFWKMEGPGGSESCSARASGKKCAEYVAGNPGDFSDSYFAVQDIRYFKEAGPEETTQAGTTDAAKTGGKEVSETKVSSTSAPVAGSATGALGDPASSSIEEYATPSMAVFLELDKTSAASSSADGPTAVPTHGAPTQSSTRQSDAPADSAAETATALAPVALDLKDKSAASNKTILSSTVPLGPEPTAPSDPSESVAPTLSGSDSLPSASTVVPDGSAPANSTVSPVASPAASSTAPWNSTASHSASPALNSIAPSITTTTLPLNATTPHPSLSTKKPCNQTAKALHSSPALFPNSTAVFLNSSSTASKGAMGADAGRDSVSGQKSYDDVDAGVNGPSAGRPARSTADAESRAGSNSALKPDDASSSKEPLSGQGSTTRESTATPTLVAPSNSTTKRKCSSTSHGTTAKATHLSGSAAPDAAPKVTAGANSATGDLATPTAPAPTAPPGPAAPLGTTAVTVYTTSTSTISACPPSVTSCGPVPTVEVVQVWYTMACPVLAVKSEPLSEGTVDAHGVKKVTMRVIVTYRVDKCPVAGCPSGSVSSMTTTKTLTYCNGVDCTPPAATDPPPAQANVKSVPETTPAATTKTSCSSKKAAVPTPAVRGSSNQAGAPAVAQPVDESPSATPTPTRSRKTVFVTVTKCHASSPTCKLGSVSTVVEEVPCSGPGCGAPTAAVPPVSSPSLDVQGNQASAHRGPGRLVAVAEASVQLNGGERAAGRDPAKNVEEKPRPELPPPEKPTSPASRVSPEKDTNPGLAAAEAPKKSAPTGPKNEESRKPEQPLPVLSGAQPNTEKSSAPDIPSTPWKNPAGDAPSVDGHVPAGDGGAPSHAPEHAPPAPGAPRYPSPPHALQPAGARPDGLKSGASGMGAGLTLRLVMGGMVVMLL